jgi:hypothetical protein
MPHAGKPKKKPKLRRVATNAADRERRLRQKLARMAGRR